MLFFLQHQLFRRTKTQSAFPQSSIWLSHFWCSHGVLMCLCSSHLGPPARPDGRQLSPVWALLPSSRFRPSKAAGTALSPPFLSAQLNSMHPRSLHMHVQSTLRNNASSSRWSKALTNLGALALLTIKPCGPGPSCQSSSMHPRSLHMLVQFTLRNIIQMVISSRRFGRSRAEIARSRPPHDLSSRKRREPRSPHLSCQILCT
ncbi:hypothetical protein IWZ00DRAFT_226046 [Phyllosticta capitalensis]